MIIYISKENEGLISCLKNTVNSNEIQTITGVKYLKKFVLQEVKNINNFQHIIIYITGLTDTEDDNIGTLTIPSILLENAPINEGIETSMLSHSIGHFPFSAIYDGNVCLASHNRGSNADYFKNIHKLKIGDKIYYQSIFGNKRYMVESINTIQY